MNKMKVYQNVDSEVHKPVFGEEVDIRYCGHQLHFVQSPAGRVHTLFWQFNRQQTLAG